MAKFILLILLLLSGMVRTWAQPDAASDIEQLQKQMYQLYNKNLNFNLFCNDNVCLRIFAWPAPLPTSLS